MLVEKAFTRNTGEAEEVFAAARAAGVFVMEAMWTRFLPHVAALHQVIDAGEIGEIVSIAADHGQRFKHDPKSRLFDPALAGGALLDLGVYPVSFTHDFLGVPDAVHAVGQLTDTGVDGQVSSVLRYGRRVQATLSTTLWAGRRHRAHISGTEGNIQVEGRFYAPTSFTVARNDGARVDFDRPARAGCSTRPPRWPAASPRAHREPAHDLGRHARRHADDGRGPPQVGVRVPGGVTGLSDPRLPWRP